MTYVINNKLYTCTFMRLISTLLYHANHYCTEKNVNSIALSQVHPFYLQYSLVMIIIAYCVMAHLLLRDNKRLAVKTLIWSGQC